MKIYLTQVLDLHVKDNYQIYPVESRGIDFVGYVCYHNHTLLRKSIKLRLGKLVDAYCNKKISKETYISRMASYSGWLKYCDSKNLLKKIEEKTNFRYSGWNGIKTNISKFKGKWIYLVNIVPHRKYFVLQFMYNKRAYEVRS
nr:MAG TPA: hypothetical protein [Bacteriophage sp.]